MSKTHIEVMQEYPWCGKFRTKTEIDDYLAGNKVQCLICGKLFIALPTHLERTHDITADNYREQYGLDKIDNRAHGAGCPLLCWSIYMPG